MKQTCIVVLAALMLTLLSHREAEACTCKAPDSNPELHLKDARAVFIGTVMSVEKWSLPMHQGEETYMIPMEWVVFYVEQAWVGPGTTRIGIVNLGSSAACGEFFEQGDRALVFAGKPWGADFVEAKLDHLAQTDSCSYRGPGNAEEIAALNGVLPPQTLVEISPDHSSLTVPVGEQERLAIARAEKAKRRNRRLLLVAAGGLALLLVAGGLLLRRRRKT